MTDAQANDTLDYERESPRSFWHSVFLHAIAGHAQAVSFAVQGKVVTITCGNGEHEMFPPPKHELGSIFVEAGRLIAGCTEIEMDGRSGRRSLLGILRLTWGRLLRKDIRGQITFIVGQYRVGWTALWSPRIETASFWLRSIEPDDPTYPQPGKQLPCTQS